MNGSLVCKVCEFAELLNIVVCSGAVADEDIFVGQKNDWATEVHGDWTDEAAANIKRLNEERGRAGISPQYVERPDAIFEDKTVSGEQYAEQLDPDDDSGC